ncbi:MAG: hypothetical protein PHQ27_08815 [Victivallales bacterium]|nr:hypothetical protein [Victivallales bacterium]
MRKLIASLMLMSIGGLSCLAAFDYEIVKSSTAGQWSDGGPGNGVYGYSYYVKVTEGSGSLYLTDKINNLYSMSGNNELLSLNANMSGGNYGWVDKSTGISYGGDGSTIVTYSHQYPNNELVTQTGYKVGDFTAGDEVGFWLTVDDTTGASILDKSNPINSSNMNYRNAFVNTDALGNELFQLDYTNGGSVFFGITGVESTTPVGQPLPGVLATMLIGGGISLWGMRRRNKA